MTWTDLHSISDPAYARAYYKAFMLNPSITQIFNKPMQQVVLNWSSDNTGAECRQTNSSTTTTTQSNLPTLNTMPPFSCYGCSSHQHTLHNCQLIQDLLCRGLLAYNQWRDIILPRDNGPLRCEGGKTLLNVYYWTTQRHEESPLREDQKGNSHLITVSRVCYKWGSANYIAPNVSNKDNSDHKLNLPHDDKTDLDEDEETNYKVYAADCTLHDWQLAWTTRKEIMDGVYLPWKVSTWRNEVMIPEETRRNSEPTNQPWAHEHRRTGADGEEKLVQSEEHWGIKEDTPKYPTPSNNPSNQRPMKNLEETKSRHDLKWSQWWDKGADANRSVQRKRNDQNDQTYWRTKAPPLPNAPLGVQTMHTLDVHAPDVVMEDTMKKGDEGKRKGSKDQLTPEQKFKFNVCQKPDVKESSRTPNIRQMELSMQTTPRDVLTKILNTQISLTVGEIIGTSWKLCIALADQICVKTMTSANAISNHICTDHGTLLQVPVWVGRYTYRAIIDSGSEVNLIKHQVWEKDLKVSIDVGASMTLHDANGGTSTLKGIIPSLELKIGELITTSNYWVTTTCPLDILLGRPWQWQNLVSIDERTEGTYVRFN